MACRWTSHSDPDSPQELAYALHALVDEFSQLDPETPAYAEAHAALIAARDAVQNAVDVPTGDGCCEGDCQCRERGEVW